MRRWVSLTNDQRLTVGGSIPSGYIPLVVSNSAKPRAASRRLFNPARFPGFTAGVVPATLGALLISCAPSAPRWYTPVHVAEGMQLFGEHCAECHRARAEGTPDWQTPGPDGNYPPPPLDGTAHTWHHSLDLLLRIVSEGGAAFRGVMPPFAEVLTTDQQRSVIAYVQSLWDDETYERWTVNDTAQ